MLDWLGLEDNREEPVDLGVNVKEIEGNETEDNAENNIDIKTEIKDGIVTTETVTREEQIIFSKQNAKTAPISVRLDESGKEIIEFKNENAVVEEETCLLENANNLEIIKGEEEVVNRVIESEKTDDEEKRENGELYENGTGEERMKSDDEENKDESENDGENKDESENDEENKDESENDESLMDEE